MTETTTPESPASAFDPLIDVGEALSFLDLLSGKTNEIFTFGSGPDDKAPRLGKTEKGVPAYTQRTGTFQSQLSWLQSRQKIGCAAYVIPQLMGESGDVTRIRCLVAELDSEVPDWPIRPSATVQTSPNKFDYYFFVKDPEGLSPEDFTGLASYLVAEHNAAQGTLDLKKPRRLPGTWNQKPEYGDPFLVQLLSNEAHLYDRIELRTAFPPVSPNEPYVVPAFGKGDLRQYVEVLRRIPKDLLKERFLDIGRALWHETSGSLAGRALWRTNCQVPEEQAETIWATLKPEAGQVPVTGAELFAMAAALRDADTGQVQRGILSFKKDGNDKVQRSQENVRVFMDYMGVSLRFNDFSNKHEVFWYNHWQLLSDEVLLNVRMAAEEKGLKCEEKYFVDCIKNLAYSNRFHPVREWRATLKWDGRKRLDRLLTDYCNAEDTELNRAYSRKFLIAALRRVMEPGCKFDCMLVLEGPQGAGKSSFAEILASKPWFSDSLYLGSRPKDTAEQTAGKWIVECAELVGMTKARREQIKGWLSRNTDHATMKYDRFGTDFPRQFVVIGTTNEDTYLDDPTGARRFWSTEVYDIDLKRLREDREQLWAEAALYESQGESLELPVRLRQDQAAMARVRIRESYMVDELRLARDSETGQNLEDFAGAVETEELWTFLNIQADRKDRYRNQELEDAMRVLGYTKERRRKGGRNPIPCYLKPGGDTTQWFKAASRQPRSVPDLKVIQGNLALDTRPEPQNPLTRFLEANGKPAKDTSGS